MRARKRAHASTIVEFSLYRSGESKKNYVKRRDAIRLFDKLLSLSGRSSAAGLEDWVLSLWSLIESERLRSRGLQAELILAIGDLGESV